MTEESTPTLIYGCVDSLARSTVGNHLQVFEELGGLESVLTFDSGGYSPSAPVHAPPLSLGKARFFLPYSISNNIFDYYLKQFITEKADALIGWSGMSSATISRANDLGLETFVLRSSPHILETRSIMNEEYQRFGVDKKFSQLDAWKECYEYQESDWIVAHSGYIAESFKQRGIDEDKIVEIPYEIENIDQYLNVSIESSSEVFRVCTATTVDLLRGIPYLLRGWEKFAKDKDDVELIVAGARGDSFPDRMYNRFARRKDVKFPGYLDDVASLYAKSDLFVLPSLADGGPAGPIEAMAAGLPVIVSENMGAADAIDEGEEGYIVPIRDPDTIADHLETLYNSQDKKQLMSEKAKAKAKSLQGREREALRNLYKEYISS